jgi:hypothetical protein
MKDLQEIKELEAQITLDKQKYSEIKRLEDELLGNNPLQRFSEATSIGRYRVEKEALAYSICVAERRWREREARPIDLMIHHQAVSKHLAKTSFHHDDQPLAQRQHHFSWYFM